MLQTNKINNDTVAVATSAKEILLRRSGRNNFNKEEPFVRIADNKLIVNKTTADRFGISITIEN